MLNLVQILTFYFTISLISEGNAKSWPKWLDIGDEVESLGDICSQDNYNDTLGRKLGCDCKFPVMTPKFNLYADCSGQTLGTENSELPLHMNVSIHVHRLIFSDNFIKELTHETFDRAEAVSDGNFARNKIQRISKVNFPRIATLDLSHNRIVNLTNDAFEGMPKLEVIDLSFNGLTFIESETFTHLEYLRILNLGSNKIGVAVEFYDEYPFKLEDLERLEEIDLSNNSLQEFPSKILEGSDHIKKLNLGNNRILYIPENTFNGLHSLETLDLSGNLFNILHSNSFLGLVSLRSLSIDANNDLILIEEHAFAGLKSLQEFSCQRNHRLASIHPLAFKSDGEPLNDSSPTTVHLGDNALTYIDSDLLYWKSLEYLDLIRNPWICDCNLQWVAVLREKNPIEAAILLDPDFKCESPAPLKGEIVAKIDSGELMCYSETASIAGIIGIIILCFILLTFLTIVGLNSFGLLPESFSRLNIFGNISSLPKYVRVRPKSKVGNIFDRSTEPVPSELEWDNGDIGR